MGERAMVYVLFLEGRAGPSFDRGEISAEEVQRFIAPYRAWLEQLKSEGKLVRADRLADDFSRRLEKRGGTVTVMDGPLAETKDIVGGYYLIEAEDDDAAQRIASSCPHLDNGGTVTLRRTRG